MINQQHVAEFMKSAVGGVSKSQIIRTFKERYDMSNAEIDNVIQLCSFRSKPKNIDYKQLYNANITRAGRRIFYNFTKIYTID